MIHTKKSIEEIYYRLSYLYFIKPESVVEEIKKTISVPDGKSELSLAEITTLFDEIFKAILKYSSPYTDYLAFSTGQRSFFGENLSKDGSQSISYSNPFVIRNALMLSLLHHCIIQSLYRSLEAETENSFRYDMNARHYSRFQEGFFSLSDKPKDSHDEQQNDRDNSIEKRTLYSQRYKVFKNLNENAYSKKLLTSFLGNPICDEEYPSRRPYFQVIPYFNLWADFIYSDKSVHYFDNALLTSKSLLQKYRTLFNVSRESINLAQSGSDKLLVSYPLEHFYAFQTFDGIFRLLTDIYNSAKQADDTLSYVDLQSEDIIELIKLLKDTPLVYNRHLLICFAYEAITSGGLSETRYLKTHPRSGLNNASSTFESKLSQKQRGLTLMEEFLLHMNTVTIPLITDLWNYIIFDINDKFDNLFDTHTFRMYIDEYYPLITADWAELSKEEIPPSKPLLRSEEEMSYFRKGLTKNLKNKPFKEHLRFLMPKNNPMLKSHMEELLKFYCSPEQLPSLYYKPENIIEPLYRPLSPGAFGNNSEELLLKQLHFDHATLLYELATKPFPKTK